MPFDELSIADINLIFQNGSFDISGCLINCTNNGRCAYLANNKIQCACLPGFTGKACEIDLRACSPKNNKCVNDGLCIEVNNTNGFDCTCTEQFTGDFCESKLDLCHNVTCSSHGSCVDLGNATKCVCFDLYLGDLCEKESVELVTVRAIISITSVIAIVIIVLFYSSCVIMDLVKYFMCRDRSKKKRIYIRRIFKYKYKP